MKRIMTLILLLSIGLTAKSQNTNSSMQNHLMTLDSTMVSGESLIPLAAKFSQLGALEKNNWLPYYYASYCYVMEAFVVDSSKTDSLLDQADQFISKADSLCKTSNKIDQSEIKCIQSLIASARITVDPVKRGMKYGMESSKMMDAAKNLNPENPRVYFLEAQSIMYTPEAYGGGCENARPTLELALEKYKKFNPTSESHPNWGEGEVKSLLEQCAE